MDKINISATNEYKLMKSREFEDRRKHPCPTCGKMIYRRAKFCNKHKPIPNGESHPLYKTGRSKDSSTGYVYVIAPNAHPRARHRRIAEHVLVWEQYYGPIPESYEIHHLNGIRDDNRIENLIALPRKYHHRLHVKKFQERIRQLESQVNPSPPS